MASTPLMFVSAARLIKQGHLVAIPTETVYGLAALSTHENYIKGIYEAKNRPNTNPLILHVHSLEQALDLWQLSSAQGETIKNWIQTLANHFWPGPLTLVAPKAPHIPKQITAGLDTVAVRCPAHPVARALLEELDMPLAAPSANLSNRPSPTCAGHVAQTLSGRIEAILDGGPCAQGLESTVLNLTASEPQILRAGAINASDLEKILPEQPIMAPLLGQAAHVAQAQQSPGQLSRHYAPANTHCTLVNQEELETFWVTEKPMVLRQETAQAFEKNGFFRPKGAFTWLMPNDAAGYAQALYRTLYEIEKSQFEEVWIEGLAARSPHSPWWAIQDRWLRASK